MWNGKTLIRVAIPATLILYVLPVVLFSFAAARMWQLDLYGQDFSAGPLSQQFVILMAQAGGPFALIQKALGIITTGAILGTLWSSKDKVVDIVLVATLVAGLLASLVVWYILTVPDIYREMWQSASLPVLEDSKSFGLARDQYFTGVIQALVSFATVLTGVKLKA